MKLPLQLTVLLGLAVAQFTAWAYPGAGAQVSATAEVEGEVEVKHILWLQADASKDNGVTAYISARLPKIKHERLSVNALRSWQMIERGEHVCRPNTIRTPRRERQAYFTDTMLAPPVELLVRRDKLDQLPRNAAGEVELKRLLAQGQLRGAAAKGRSYGDYVDGLLADAGNRKSFTRYATEGFGLRLLDMLARDRADYLIEHDGGLQQMRQRNLGAEQFTSLPIQGATEAPVAGIACPRTPWGLAAIRAIDQVIGTPAGAAELRRSTIDWLSPEAQQRMATQIKQFYQHRAKPSDPR